MFWFPLIAALPAAFGPGDGGAPPIAVWHAVAVIGISESGKILSCVDETEGGPPAGLGDPCVSFEGETPPPMLEGLGGAGAARRVTIEMAMAVDSEPRPALRYHQASQLPNALASARFDVSAKGKTQNCRKLDTGAERWTVKLPSLCSVVRPSYAPPVDARGGARRAKATFTIAFSTAR
ncbi:hypothetical protein AB2M62_09250 [Sphingomonas sp. MMS12-HWE2-04]|uniref:hypothetical protein n=1 Tax=Sphingomonas sp. MMS12-HWE2-04 TaxID=3234199 RepID=UPI00384DEF31